MGDSAVKFPNSPSMPLFPLSPERVNGIRSPHGMHPPQSPVQLQFMKPSDFSLNASSPPRPSHSRNNSEALVQGMVARFDSLSLKDHQQIHKRDEVAIKREQMAREMAELELSRIRLEREELEADNKKYREECRRLKKESEENKDRDRKLVKRLAAQEDVIERSSQTQEHQKTLLEKEVRKLRKEAYKTQSALLKSQEDLKAVRNSLRVTQAGVEAEKAKSSKREQEAFTAEYKLVGLFEEFTKLQESMKIVEEERNALKTSLQEEEVALIAAEGRIALPAVLDDEVDEFATPKRSPRKRVMDMEDKENATPRQAFRSNEMKNLQEELAQQRRMRHKAEDQVEFMKMECQFRCCSCRVAEQQGSLYVHDDRFVDEMGRLSQVANIPLPRSPIPPTTNQDLETSSLDIKEDTMQMLQSATPLEQLAEEHSDKDTNHSPDSETPDPEKVATKVAEEEQSPLETEDVNSASELAIRSQSPANVDEDNNATVVHNPPEDVKMVEPSSDEASSAMPSSSSDQTPPVSPELLPQQTPRGPQTPRFREVRTVTTTTTIPMTFTPSASTAPSADHAHAPQTPVTIGHAMTAKMPISPFPGTPGALRPDGTLDREAALEQIRLRRGRARSVALGLATPKKQLVEGVARRDISAPTLKGRG